MIKDANFIEDEAARSEGYVAGPAQGPTLGESWAAGLGLFMSEDMSISRFMHDSNGRAKDRNDTIRQAIKDGKLDSDILQRHMGTQGRMPKVMWDDVAREAKERGIDVMTDEELDADLRVDLATYRKYSEDVWERGEGLNSVAYVAGQFQGAAVDPVNVASMFAVPTKAWQAMKYGQRLTAAAAVNIAAETAIQPIVYDWKQSIGSPYSLSDALVNIGFAGVAGAGFEGLQIGISKAYHTGKHKATNPYRKIRKKVEILRKEELNKKDLADQQKLSEYNEVIKTLKFQERELGHLQLPAEIKGIKQVDVDDVIQRAREMEGVERNILTNMDGVFKRTLKVLGNRISEALPPVYRDIGGGYYAPVTDFKIDDPARLSSIAREMRESVLGSMPVELGAQLDALLPGFQGLNGINDLAVYQKMLMDAKEKVMPSKTPTRKGPKGKQTDEEAGAVTQKVEPVEGEATVKTGATDEAADELPLAEVEELDPADLDIATMVDTLVGDESLPVTLEMQELQLKTLLESNPDMEVPVGGLDADGNPITMKASDIMKEANEDIDKLDKFIACMIRP